MIKIQCFSKKSKIICLSDFDDVKKIECKNDYSYAKNLIKYNENNFINIEHDIIFSREDLEEIEGSSFDDCDAIVRNYNLNNQVTANRKFVLEKKNGIFPMACRKFF